MLWLLGQWAPGVDQSDSPGWEPGFRWVSTRPEAVTQAGLGPGLRSPDVADSQNSLSDPDASGFPGRCLLQAASIE